MGAVLVVARAELRRRWRSLALIVVVVGLAGGATLGSIAGARRTSSSFDRLLAWTRSQDVLVLGFDVAADDVARVRALPGVKAVGVGRLMGLAGPDGGFLAGGAVVAPLDDVIGRDVVRVRIVAGRAPAEGAAEEVAVGEAFAGSSGLRVGDELPVAAYTQEQFEQLREGFGPGDPAGPRISLRVVGISRSPDDLNLQASAGGVLVLPRAFVEKYGDRVGSWYGQDGAVLGVVLTQGDAGIPDFVDRLDGILEPGSFDIDPVALTRGGVQESIDLLATAALLFGVIAGGAGLIAVGLTAARQVGLLAREYGPLRGFGLAPRWRAAAAAGPVLLAVSAGAGLAVVVGWGVSPLFPFGVAGDAEPHPGLAFDAVTLLAGGAAVLIVVGLLVAGAAWRAVAVTATGTAAPPRPSRVTRSLEAVGMAPPVTVGVRMALEPGRGRTAVPVRSALAGAVLAVLGVTAVLVFGASLDHLLATPSAQGRVWDAAVNDTTARPVDGTHRCGAAETRLLDEPDIEAIAMYCWDDVAIGGHAVGAVSLTPLRGSMQPTVLEGRAPSGVDEVALGTHTLQRLGLQVGDRASVRTSEGPIDHRIVGRVIVPGGVDPQAIADGAVFSAAGFDRIQSADSDGSLVVRFRPGVDQPAAMARIVALPGIGGYLGDPGVIPTAVPVEVERLHQVDRVPDTLAVLLAVLGALAVGHLLVTSVRRRRHDLAVLKCLGLRRRQLMAAVAWQATAVAGFGITLGVTGGVAAGAILWRATADDVGVVPSVDMPILALTLLAAATVAVAILVAASPARHAAKVPAATILRTE
ncbi:MAG: FtsX-like permease family protein [Acidimicrobiales bacterium]